MAAFLALSLQAMAVGSDAGSEAACQIGASILSQAPDTGTPRRPEEVYDDKWRLSLDSIPPSSIFNACPLLRDRLPSNKRLATDADRKRATGLRQSDPLTIFGISAPNLNASGTEATIVTGYSCPGLCGGLFLSRYRLVHRRWERIEAPQLKVVS